MIDKKNTSTFYLDLLKDDFMRFWKKAFDTEYGGVFTCFLNDGKRLLSTDKYIWSQGRVIWMLSRYVSLIDKGIIDDDREFYFNHAKKTYEFVKKNAILPREDGVCAYLTERDGTKKESIPGKGFYTSFFVDTFVIMGFAEFAKVSGNIAILDEAFELYDRTREYLDRGEVVSEPYPQNKFFAVQANPMIMTNTTFVLYEAAEVLGHSRYNAILEDAVSYVRNILDFFYSEELGLLREQIPLKPEYEDTIYANYISPGHAVESMWFCLNVVNKANMGQKYKDRIYKCIKNSIRTGWDKEYGGLFRSVGYDGKKPKGRLLDEKQECLLLDTWDSKLWWPHSECLYATLRCYLETGDDEFFEMYKMFYDYCFRVFPNPDKEIGEWIQILDRDGTPMDKVVALPVKDPYHIVRNLILIIELLTGEIEEI